MWVGSRLKYTFRSLCPWLIFTLQCPYCSSIDVGIDLYASGVNRSYADFYRVLQAGDTLKLPQEFPVCSVVYIAGKSNLSLQNFTTNKAETYYRMACPAWLQKRTYTY